MRIAFICKETNTAKFGGPLSKPENIFIAETHRVSPYIIQVEKNHGSGGWIEEVRTELNVVDDTYIIVKNKEIVGVSFGPHYPYKKSKVYSLSELSDRLPSEIEAINREIEKIKHR